jgi:hypothetical protein
VSEPTEQDRLKATDLIAEHGTGDPDFFGDLTAAIAAALAEERAKARAPFLALADEYDRHAGLMRAQAESTGVPDMVPWNGTGAQPKPAWPRPVAATARRNAA